MTEAPHQLLRRIFDGALTLPRQERAAFVARECGADTGLHDRIVRLLEAGEHTHFLSAPEQAQVAAPALPASEGVGSTIGPYTLVRELGQGGFGVVFLAEQTKPVARQVALKVLKPGMDSRTIVARFAQERQALARMEHPHIARVIDAGATTAERPFFVMEYVDGLPIAEYCDQRQQSVPQRLELFLQVCDAVQHAHGRGVIHRDLKPSNVLVAEQDGKPFGKVIDFGIAKAIHERAEDHTALTEAEQVLGTLLYMSPEQAAGAQDLDVRTDVFSLGAMLYELLAGSAPFDVETMQGAWRGELQRRIRDVDPPPPSRRITTSGSGRDALAQRRHTTSQRLRAMVQGELDWIVMKALEKDRGRRYATAHAFAEDLRRYLAGAPVFAAPPSASYRVRKFVHNHRWQVAAAVALLLSLLGGSTAFAWQADVARTERDNANDSRLAEATQHRLADERAAAAQKAREQAETMTRFVIQALESSDPYRGGKEGMSVRDAMAKAVERLDAGALRDLPATEVELRTRIAAILYSNSGADQAVPVAHRAVELARQSGSDQAEALVGALGIHAVALGRAGRAAEGAPLLEEALQLQRRRVPGDDSFTVLLLGTLTRSRLDQGRIPEAEPLATEALAMAERLWPDDSFELANVLSLRADVLKEMGRLPEAEQLAAAGYAMHRRLFDGDHPDIGSALASLANAELLQGKLEPATKHYEELLAMYRRLFAVPGAQQAVAVHNLGVAYWSAGQAARAEPLFQEALELHRKVFPSDHPTIARNLKNLGSAWRVLGKKADAERVLLESVAMWDRLFPEGHPEYADSLLGLAVLHRELGRLDDALHGAESAVEMRRTTLGPDHPELARTLYLVGELHAQRNAAALAVAPYRESLLILQRAHGGDHAEVVTLHMRLADALLGSAQPAAAAPHYQAAIDVQTRLGGGEANVAYCWSGLARSRQESGDTVGARAAFEEALARLAKVAPNGSMNRARTLWRSGSARLAAGDAAAALPELESAFSMGTKVLPADHAHLTDYRKSVDACQAALAR